MGGLAPKKPKAPPPPEIKPVVEMPDPEASAESRRRRQVEIQQRSGRESTILTDKLGA